MNRKLTAVTLSAAVLAVAAAPSMASTTIGMTDQGNVQGTNSDQSGINGTGLGGDTSVLGDSAPVLVQTSANVGADSQALAGGDTTLIANGPAGGFSQLNASATNSEQTAVNGDSGQNIAMTTPVLTQHSLNVVISTELLAAVGDAVLIGSDAQNSSQGANSAQSANDFPGGGATPSGLLQDSTNLVVSGIVLGD